MAPYTQCESLHNCCAATIDTELFQKSLKTYLARMHIWNSYVSK